MNFIITLMSTIVLYHSNCPDGFTAAWAIWKSLPSATFIPVSHGEEPPTDLDNKDVVIVDYCYPREVLLALATKASSLTVLDHHLSSMRLCGDLSFCVFDMNRSGAGMAWDFFHPNHTRPPLVDYVEYRDLGNAFTKKEHPWDHYLEIMAALDSYNRDFETWDFLNKALLSTQTRAELIAEGKGILRYQKRLVDQLVANADEINIEGYLVKSVNTPVLMSEVAGRLASSSDLFGAAWYQTNEEVKFSLRAAKDSNIDVATIASHFGGGGHAKAAGFKLDVAFSMQNLVDTVRRR